MCKNSQVGVESFKIILKKIKPFLNELTNEK